MLVAVVGATIGKVGTVPSNWAGANIARAVCRIVPSREIDRAFLIAALRSRAVQNYFHNVTRTLAQPTLNIRQLEVAPIPDLPIDDQRRLVIQLSALGSRVEAAERLQAESATELDSLLPAVLADAFAGRL